MICERQSGPKVNRTVHLVTADDTEVIIPHSRLWIRQGLPLPHARLMQLRLATM